MEKQSFEVLDEAPALLDVALQCSYSPHVLTMFCAGLKHCPHLSQISWLCLNPSAVPVGVFLIVVERVKKKDVSSVLPSQKKAKEKKKKQNIQINRVG